MEAVDVLIMIACFFVIILLFLQPTSQDKLAGFLSGSVDVSSYQNVKERGSVKILLNLTIFFVFLIIILLIVARLTL